MNVQDLNDCFPEYEKDYDQEVFAVLENADPGTLVGDPIIAKDGDITDIFSQVTFRPIDILFPFEIDETSGQISVSSKNGVTMDYETVSSYAISITATDSESV